jgi:8-oxo-dGTP pyrophosphatase MutT (NUDIX family)
MDVEIMELIRILHGRLLPTEQTGNLNTVHYAPAQEFGWRTEVRRAAVLIPLFKHEGQLSVMFIRRASTLRAHSGEIAFPGGSVEAIDDSVVETALRETQEEIGLNPQRVEVLGLLPPVFTAVSNFVVTPVVAFLPKGPGELLLQASEVAELIIIPLQALMDPAIVHTEEWTRGGITRTIHFYDYGSYRIWGATGRMLSELLMVLASGVSIE